MQSNGTRISRGTTCAACRVQHNPCSPKLCELDPDLLRAYAEINVFKSVLRATPSFSEIGDMKTSTIAVMVDAESKRFWAKWDSMPIFHNRETLLYMVQLNNLQVAPARLTHVLGSSLYLRSGDSTPLPRGSIGGYRDSVCVTDAAHC